MIARPQSNEYAAFYDDYIKRVPEGSDIFEILSRQPGELCALLQTISDEQANSHPASGEWSVKEIIGHMCDIERIWAYQAFRCSRGDGTSLPGFDYEAYVREAYFNRRTLKSLLDEFTAQRDANVLYFKALTAAETERSIIAGDYLMTVRARLYMMVGHVMHHMESLRTDYKVNG